jgi:hypothetical protein
MESNNFMENEHGFSNWLTVQNEKKVIVAQVTKKELEKKIAKFIGFDIDKYNSEKNPFSRFGDQKVDYKKLSFIERINDSNVVTTNGRDRKIMKIGNLQIGYLFYETYKHDLYISFRHNKKELMQYAETLYKFYLEQVDLFFKEQDRIEKEIINYIEGSN